MPHTRLVVALMAVDVGVALLALGTVQLAQPSPTAPPLEALDDPDTGSQPAPTGAEITAIRQGSRDALDRAKAFADRPIPPRPRIDIPEPQPPAVWYGTILARLPEKNSEKNLDIAGVHNVDCVVADRDEQPISFYATYPSAAAEAGIEGTCQVKVDVAPNGFVENPRAQCTDPIFVEQVERDALKWRYQPCYIDGVGIFWADLIVTVDFALAD